MQNPSIPAEEESRQRVAGSLNVCIILHPLPISIVACRCLYSSYRCKIFSLSGWITATMKRLRKVTPGSSGGGRDHECESRNGWNLVLIDSTRLLNM